MWPSRCFKWRWSPEDQHPPVETVLRSKFWSAAEYKHLRNKLKEPIVDTEVSETAQYNDQPRQPEGQEAGGR